MNKAPLSRYIFAVVVLWVVILSAMWFMDYSGLYTFAVFCAGFFVGLLAMYIAVHLYRWK